VELVTWRYSAHSTLPECEINVLRGYRVGQGEVLEDGGEEEEQFLAGNAFTKTNSLPCGKKGSAMWALRKCSLPSLMPKPRHLCPFAIHVHGLGI
jgi:hypothetical protein